MQNNSFYSNITLNLRGRLYLLDAPKVMGILNVTPDSFYAGSRVSSEKELLDRAARMIAEGAHFIDIGGYSTRSLMVYNSPRPGAAPVTEAEELERVVPAIRALSTHFPDALISVDTFRASVAAQAVEAGAVLINDVTGGEGDAKMMETAGDLNVPYVLMHMRGTPGTMTSLTHYDNLLKDLAFYFQEKLTQLRSHGVKDVILDPGFGFAKTVDQNFELLRQLSWFRDVFKLPLLVGLSRKTMIWRTLESTPEAALNGTTGLHMLALQQGAAILRVHDVKEAVECIALYQKTQQTLSV